MSTGAWCSPALLVSLVLVCAPGEPPARVEVRPGCSAELMSITVYRRPILDADRDVTASCYRTVTACGTAYPPAWDGAWYWSYHLRDSSTVPLVNPCRRGERLEYSAEHPHGLVRADGVAP